MAKSAKKVLRTETLTCSRVFVNDCGEFWSIEGANIDEDDDARNDDEVRIVAPCGNKVCLAKDEWIELRAAIDKFFKLGK